MRLTILALWLCAAGPGQAAETLQDLVGRIDQAAAQFKGMTARIIKVSYTAVIQDKTEERGLITMRLAKPRQLEVLLDLSEPDPRIWTFRNRTAEAYYPKIKTVQIYDLGKQGNLVDQFLLLGFGSTGKELAKNYTLRVTGEDVVDGKKSTCLELIPKSAKALEHLTKVEIWFPASAGYPVRQKFHQRSGDYVLVTYLETRLNSNLPEDAVRLKLPAGVKKEYPQK
jgi:outer membrane lipoprotein-sorting protein